MDSVSMTLVKSSPNACTVTNGGNFSQGRHSNKNIYYASSYASKASLHKKKTQLDYKIWRFLQPSLNHHYKCIGGSSYQERNKKYVAKGTYRSDFDPKSHISYVINILDLVKKFWHAFFMFTTPYSMITQALSIISASLLVLEKLSDISPLFFIGVLQVVVPNLIMGIYVAGVNQLCDLEIDRINKPYLPLVSGQISFTAGIIVATSSLTLSFWIGWIIGSWPLIWGLILSCFLWTAYSINVPLFRWKGHPLLAAMCVFATWAIIFPISSFLHMQTFVFKRPIIFPGSLIFVVAFMSFYSIGIALCKDIPDLEGDTTFGIYSFSARFGQKRIFWICLYLFEMAFGVALLVGIASPYLWIKFITGLGHVVLASVLWYQAKSTDLRNKASIASFYKVIWKLLCAEYFLMPLIR